MITSTKQHLSNNKGDANVSKMTLIAVAFVVGAILLVLTTSAFKNPINRWLAKVSNDWFAEENGEFNLMLDPLAAYEKRENGTYKGLQYIKYYSDGSYAVLSFPSSPTGYYGYQKYTASGQRDGWPWLHGSSGEGVVQSVSDDGLTITFKSSSWGTWTAQVPGS